MKASAWGASIPGGASRWGPGRGRRACRGGSLFCGPGLAEQGVGRRCESPGVPAMLSGPNGFLPLGTSALLGARPATWAGAALLHAEGSRRGREGKTPELGLETGREARGPHQLSPAPPREKGNQSQAGAGTVGLQENPFPLPTLPQRPPLCSCVAGLAVHEGMGGLASYSCGQDPECLALNTRNIGPPFI